jgi:hypothetical protein
VSTYWDIFLKCLYYWTLITANKLTFTKIFLMKKVLMSLGMLLGVTCAYAQPAISVPFVGVDSLINTDTVTKDLTLSTTLNGIILQPVITRVSGTAAGKVVLLQSIDGANFIRTDSITISNLATNTAFFIKSQPTALYYKVQFTSSGTTTLWPQLWYLPRKEK